MSPKKGLDTKTDWLTDRQPQCDFDFDKGIHTKESNYNISRNVGKSSTFFAAYPRTPN
jgi:hypothetical protein